MWNKQIKVRAHDEIGDSEVKKMEQSNWKRGTDLDWAYGGLLDKV